MTATSVQRKTSNSYNKLQRNTQLVKTVVPKTSISNIESHTGFKENVTMASHNKQAQNLQQLCCPQLINQHEALNIKTDSTHIANTTNRRTKTNPKI